MTDYLAGHRLKPSHWGGASQHWGSHGSFSCCSPARGRLQNWMVENGRVLCGERMCEERPGGSIITLSIICCPLLCLVLYMLSSLLSVSCPCQPIFRGESWDVLVNGIKRLTHICLKVHVLPTTPQVLPPLHDHLPGAPRPLSCENYACCEANSVLSLYPDMNASFK